jgi:hypothetical protein
MNHEVSYPVYFGALSGTNQPFFGETTFCVSTGTYGEEPNVHYAYAHYRLISYASLITRDINFAWVPAEIDEKEAVSQIQSISNDSETRLRFGLS